MTASTKVDGPEVEATVIATIGVWSLSTEPRIDAIRKATRPECRPITDTHQMEGSQFLFGRGLQVRALGRLGEVDLLGSNVDQDVLALMEPLEVSSVPLVYLAAGPGHIPRIEAHRRSPYHVPAHGWEITPVYRSLHRLPPETLHDE
jgi:hypothetical protein